MIKCCQLFVRHRSQAHSFFSIPSCHHCNMCPCHVLLCDHNCFSLISHLSISVFQSRVPPTYCQSILLKVLFNHYAFLSKTTLQFVFAIQQKNHIMKSLEPEFISHYFQIKTKAFIEILPFIIKISLKLIFMLYFLFYTCASLFLLPFQFIFLSLLITCQRVFTNNFSILWSSSLEICIPCQLKSARKHMK